MERCGFEIMFEGMNINSFIVSSSYNFGRGPFVFSDVSSGRSDRDQRFPKGKRQQN